MPNSEHLRASDAGEAIRQAWANRSRRHSRLAKQTSPN
jgi:hypothetical protein